MLAYAHNEEAIFALFQGGQFTLSTPLLGLQLKSTALWFLASCAESHFVYILAMGNILLSLLSLLRGVTISFAQSWLRLATLTALGF